MSLELTIRNRQRGRGLNVRLLRRITCELLEELLQLEDVALGITLVSATAMARINGQFLQHEGSTDVITFDHTEAQNSRRRPRAARATVRGELFICIDDAVVQARTFRTSWQAEVVRYVVHGILHLCGYDDHRGAGRRLMKQEENRLVRRLAANFAFRELAGLRADG